MTTSLAFRDGDARVRRLNAKPVNARGEFVLYWAQAFRRADDNAALCYAIERANELGVPCFVYEALRPDYPYASDRIHAFVLDGMREMAARLEARGLGHAFFLPRTPAEARGVVAKLAGRAKMIVSDDFPTFIVPGQNAAAAAHAACAYAVVDDCAVVPMSLFPKQETAARTFRPKLAKVLDEWLRPLVEVRPKVAAPSKISLPFDPVDPAADVDALISQCEIDHDVARVGEFTGGMRSGKARLDRFVQKQLSSYDVDRNDPSRDATSSLSPYLHFGMLSARRAALAVREVEREREGPTEATTAFLEQLLVRRGVAFNFARTQSAHARYEAVPGWARASLEAHARDTQKYVLPMDALTTARTDDPLWNAAQLELRARGVVHGYARMLWGKLPIAWSSTPADAHAALVHLNDRFALDGRDPNGYANISWCFGLHDRPWPERPVFGKVRTMTSRSARAKLDFDDYIARAEREWR